MIHPAQPRLRCSTVEVTTWYDEGYLHLVATVTLLYRILLHRRDLVFAVLRVECEAVEPEHLLQPHDKSLAQLLAFLAVADEGIAHFWRDSRRGRVVGRRLGEREEQLDIVVIVLELGGVVAVEVGDGAGLRVDDLAEEEVDDEVAGDVVGGGVFRGGGHLVVRHLAGGFSLVIKDVLVLLLKY